MLVREAVELVVVDPLIVFTDAVRHDGVELSGEVERMPVSEVAAVRQVHAKDGVARLEEREVHRHVRLRAGVRLHVHVLGAEDLFGARDGERLGNVDELAPAVVPFARVTFRVLVGQHRAGRFEHSLADEVLGGDQLEPAVLSMHFLRDRPRDLGIRIGQRAPAGRRISFRCHGHACVLLKSLMGESAGGVHRRVLLPFDFGDLVDRQTGGLRPAGLPIAVARGGPAPRSARLRRADVCDRHRQPGASPRRTPIAVARGGPAPRSAPAGRSAAADNGACCCRSISAILVDTALMPATLEGRVEPEGQDLVREPESDDAGAKRENVRVVVLARQAGRVQIVAQRSARAEYFVGGHLLALSAAADDDPAIRPSGRNRPGDTRADSRIIDRHVAVGAMIVDLVPETRQRRHEVQL